MIAAVPSSTPSPSLAWAWPSTITTTPAKATIEPSSEREPIRSCRKTAASRTAISGAMKVSEMAWAKRHAPDAPEEQEGHDGDVDGAGDVDSKRRPVGPGLAPGQIERGAERQVGERAPDADRDDADDEHEMLHHRVHDRQHRDRAQRDDKGLDRMLGDAVHRVRLADYSAASSVASRVSAASISAAFASTSFTIWSIISASFTWWSVTPDR